MTENRIIHRSWACARMARLQKQIHRGEIPEWLGELRADGSVERARNKAELGKDTEEELLAVMLTLDHLLSAALPPPAEVRKELKALVTVTKTFRGRLIDVPFRVECELFYDWEHPEQVPGDLHWRSGIDDLLTAVDKFLELAGEAKIPDRSKEHGEMPSSLAILPLVSIVLALRPDISRACLTKLAEDLLGPVIDSYNDRHKTNHKHPDWHDRVGQYLKEPTPEATITCLGAFGACTCSGEEDPGNAES